MVVPTKSLSFERRWPDIPQTGQQKPATAKETASGGILAAALEIEAMALRAGWLEGCDHQTCFMLGVKGIISKHCVGKESYSSLAKASAEVFDEMHATEKARADNLQAELDACQDRARTLTSNQCDAI